MASFNTLGISQRIPTRIGGTRWLPHTRLALKNILHGYDAIVQHLQQVNKNSLNTVQSVTFKVQIHDYD